jgi:hypothetical protein
MIVNAARVPHMVNVGRFIGPMRLIVPGIGWRLLPPLEDFDGRQEPR